MDEKNCTPRKHCGIVTKLGMKVHVEKICKCLEMQRDCALRIASRRRLTSLFVEYKTGNQSIFECDESFTKEELRKTCHYAVFEDNMSSCRSLRRGESSARWKLGGQLAIR
ncbi:uncharacterized protein TNCV_3261881 [Trichonephila clavipes]|nr:uncharacterized protein TNCV_3261881 [Trichonephila clavipes]